MNASSLFLVQFWWVFFLCIPLEKSNIIGHKRHDLSLTVIEIWGVKKRPRPNFWNFFISHQILMFFLQMIPYEKCNKSYPKHFFIKINVFCVKGVKGFKKWDFAGDVKFLFSSDFDGVFCIWFLSMRAFNCMSTDFLYLLLFLSFRQFIVYVG